MSNLNPATHPKCAAHLLQSCPTLCNAVDYSPPGYSVTGILQARILKWIALYFFRESSYPEIEPESLCLLIGRRVLSPTMPSAHSTELYSGVSLVGIGHIQNLYRTSNFSLRKGA